MNVTPVAAASNFTPTQVAMNRQDSSVLPTETVTIGVQRGDKPASKDYVVADSVKPDANGEYILDAKADPTGFASMSVLANLQTGLDTFLQYCDQDKTPSKWFKGGPEQLPIFAYDRKEPNAFFNAQPFNDHGTKVAAGVHFGVFDDPKTNQTIYAAHSGEVTGHEGGPGHATLNRFRPNYMRTMAPEVRAYHEAFGDVSEMLTQLKDPKVLDLVASQTQGDFSKHNALADVGEQFGHALNNLIESKGGPKNYTGGDYVRTAINDLKYQDPDQLPSRPNPNKPDQLSSEPHDFSRLWTGAIYSILGQDVAARMKGGADAKAAIAGADEDMLKIYGKLTSSTSPEGDFTFADMAQAMIKADQQVGTNLGGLIQAEMTKRLILPQQNGMVDTEIDVPSGSYDVNFSFKGEEPAFAGTQLANLGGFNVVAPQSGQPVLGISEDLHTEAKESMAKNLARLAQDGRILFTTPDQRPEDIGMFDKDGEPYVAIVNWVNGQASLERVPIA